MLFLAAAFPARAVTIEALVGIGPSADQTFFRMNTWTPIMVFLKGEGVNGVGQVQVTAPHGDRTVTYTRRIVLHEGTMNEALPFVFQPRPFTPNSSFANPAPGPPEITIQLLVDGRKLAEKAVPLPSVVSPESYNILTLTRDGSGLSFLDRRRLDLVHRHATLAGASKGMGFGGGLAGIAQGNEAEVFSAEPRSLPGMGQGYDMLDAVVLGDTPLDQLTADQEEALRDYVRRGGLLLVSGGADLTRLKGRFLADLLPVAPDGARAISGANILQQRYRVPFRDRTSLALTTGPIRPEARMLLIDAAAGAPLIAARGFGSGTVVFTTFDLFSVEMRTWKGTTALWHDLLRCGNDSFSPRSLLSSTAFPVNDRYRSFQNGTPLTDALAGLQAASAPSTENVALFLGAYILLLVPVSYFVLKRLDRRELAWFTTPVIVAGFTIAAYLLAQSVKGRMLVVNRAVVVETQANTDQAAGYGQFTLYSPRRADYDIALGNGNAYRAIAPGEIYPRQRDGAAPLTVEHDRTTAIRGARVLLWDRRSFDTPVVTSLGGPIDVQSRYVQDRQVEFTIVNRTRLTLRGCALVNANEVVPIGDLAPGQTVQQTLQWESTTGAGMPTLPSPYAQSGRAPDRSVSPDVEQLRRRIALGLVQSLTVEAPGPSLMPSVNQELASPALNAFVGWCFDPLLDIRVDGRKPEGEEVNLVMVHLPAPDAAPALLRQGSNPFAEPPESAPSEPPPHLGARQGIFK